VTDAQPIERVGFIGLGIMGSRMAANLCRAGFGVVAWNRTRERAEELAAAHGAPVAESPAEAAGAGRAVITMVVDSPQVEQVLFGPHGAAETMTDTSLAIDMSTIAPSASRAIAVRLRDVSGASFLDAPVSGSSPKAEDGTLTIMVGGERADFERARPLFEAMGQVLVHVGPHGHGEMAKVVNNTVAAINAAAVGEALALGRAAGLDLEPLRRVVAAGSGASAMLDLKAEPMAERDYRPLFKLEHMLKDVRHTLEEARSLGMELELGALAERLYAEAAQSGHAEQDFAAVYAAVAA
jgi:3-hydroxyisobutyrate dehydrogenase